MYKIKKAGIINFGFGKNKEVCEKIGISQTSLSRILNGLATTKYPTAYCIVKAYDSTKEVLDFFDKK